MSSYLLPVTTLIIGSMLGIISGYVLSLFKKKDDFYIKIIDEFLKVRREVCDSISELTNLGRFNEVAEQDLKEYANKVSNLFYKHYDILPMEVLNSLVLLEFSLLYSHQGPFEIINRRIVPVKFNSFLRLIEKTSLFENNKIILLLRMRSNDEREKRAAVIALHARYTLASLNELFSVGNLVKSTKQLIRPFQK